MKTITTRFPYGIEVDEYRNIPLTFELEAETVKSYTESLRRELGSLGLPENVSITVSPSSDGTRGSIFLNGGVYGLGSFYAQ